MYGKNQKFLLFIQKSDEILKQLSIFFIPEAFKYILPHRINSNDQLK